MMPPSAFRFFAKPFAVLVGWLGFCAAASAQSMPIDQPIRRAESDHFVVLFQESLAHLVPDLVRECEMAHAVLSPIFRWTPREKTTVFFHDGSDEHNGWATTLPRPRMSFYAAGPSPSSIYEPGGYLRSTLWHEYAHVLTMDARLGLGGWLGRVFGRFLPTMGDPLSAFIALWALPPGLLAPEWYLEGLAIWTETEFTQQGRGRQSIADMVTRMAVADGRTLDPEQWNLAHPEWPYGNAAYLWGARAMQTAQSIGADDPARNAVGELADSVNRSLLWFFDDCARPVAGQSFAQIARAALEAESAYQIERLQTLRSLPPTSAARLTPPRMQIAQPKFADGGREIVFVANLEAARDVLHRYDLQTGQSQPVSAARVQYGISRLAANAARDRFVYTRLNVEGRDRTRTELRAFDPAGGRTRRLAAAPRYRFPALSPDGSLLAAVRAVDGICRLVEIPLADSHRPERARVLAESKPFDMIVDPVYSPDGRWLVFVAGREGRSELVRIDRETHRRDTLLDWPCIVLAPAFHPNGRELVFSADANGVFNLYRLPFEPGAAPAPLTHVLGGLFEPDFSPDGSLLAAAGYDSHGFHLVLFETKNLPPIEAALPLVRREWRGVPQNQQRLREAEAIVPAAAPSVPYRSLAHVRLDHWTPWAMASEDRWSGGLAAAFSDPVGIHSLALAGGYDGHSEIAVGSASYAYAGQRPVFSAFAFRAAQTYADLVADDEGRRHDYEESVGGGGMAVAFPLPRADRDWTFSLGYRFVDREVLESAETNYAGRAVFPTNLFEGAEASLFALVEYVDATAYSRSHSAEGGRRIFAGIEWSDRSLGGDLDRVRAAGLWQEYVTLPWRENHVLKLEGLVGAGSGDRTAQGFFGVGGMDGGVDEGPGVGRTASLRGYEPNTQVGRSAAKLGMAYRFPLHHAYRGLGPTLPIYRQQLFGELFAESARAWGDEPAGQSRNRWLSAVGAELNYSMTLLRALDLAPGVGVAYAFDREPSGDRPQAYLSVKASTSF